MPRDEVQAWLRREPFQPFAVKLSSGETYEVPHLEYAALLKNSLIVAFPDSDRYAECALLHVASIERMEVAGKSVERN
ncbi:MAG: hypothetical protein WD066_20495 [Planctomycetaceae bacterium]